MDIDLGWRGPVTDAELAGLHAACFGAGTSRLCSQLERHSLGWACARTDGGELVGFLNVVSDGGVHGFVLDTMVLPEWRRRGIATALISCAVDASREHGCQWLHADFGDHLAPLYLEAAGFSPSAAGVLRL